MLAPGQPWGVAAMVPAQAGRRVAGAVGRLPQSLGYFKLTVAYQKGHLPAQLLLPLGSCEGGRGSAGFRIFQDVSPFNPSPNVGESSRALARWLLGFSVWR